MARSPREVGSEGRVNNSRIHAETGLPGSNFAICAHWFPSFLWASYMPMSSLSVHASFLQFGEQDHSKFNPYPP